MNYRHELKYLINRADAALLKERLAVLLNQDAHAEDGAYSIRSLYFDDYWDTAYADKIGGYASRKKYRIRLYNRDDRFIRLECKHKQGNYVCKTDAPLSPDEANRLLAGDCSFLLRRAEPICGQFYYEHQSRMLRPKVYVDYERQPFTLAAGDVRITLDSDVRGAFPTGGLTDADKGFQYVLEPGKLVLEVKFTAFLPRPVRELLPLRAAELSAVSKYTLCRAKVFHLTGIKSE